ncbi:uncharacterized protein LOC117500161 [Trematomus bernacchii]|uniref:uncharacterized protein LOC117500161 n=1 Tax=Trematomus bernacchii TaxID=40690 RepID=UPI00146A4AB0|nr:uncharacterized protein LOC117500161 [Trematomus bernacchii]
MFISVILGLLVCTEAQGIRSGTVFVLKGEDVLLNVTKADVLQDVFSFSWTFNKKKKVLTVNPGNNPIVFPDYAGRIEFLVNNFSVKLKNLKEADSGVYTAVVAKLSGDVTEAAKYKIKVQDRVSLPLLTVSSVSDNSSSCSFTVTCSSQDSHINSTFTCDTRTCSQEGGERSEGIPDTFLQVDQSSGSIICNHSNHVSWTNDTKTIKDVCPKHFGISAGTVFVLKGEDLLLNVTKAVVLQDVFSFSWKCNENKNSLQEADSGVYTAEVIKLSGGETEAAKYKIKVQDRASLPLLTVSSVSDSSPSCSFTVTCSSQDSHINSTFTCETRTCSQEGGERSEGIPDTFLQVHQSSGSIICNYSNHVSWTNSTKTIKAVCAKHDVPPKPNPVRIILGVFFTILILAIIGVVGLWCLRKRRTSKRMIVENTIYDTAQFVAPAGPQDPTDDEDSALSSCYAMVGPHTGPAAPTEPRNTAQPESVSVYAQVKKTTPGP